MIRFAFIERMKKAYPIELFCRVMRVSSRGYRSWRKRPLSERAREDIILSAHIRAQAKLCNFSYGSIRMTIKLRDLGFHIGKRRTARLMAANDIKVIRMQKYMRTTDSFCKTIKAELIWRGQWMTRAQTETAIGNYIERFYNPV